MISSLIPPLIREHLPNFPHDKSTFVPPDKNTSNPPLIRGVRGVYDKGGKGGLNTLIVLYSVFYIIIYTL